MKHLVLQLGGISKKAASELVDVLNESEIYVCSCTYSEFMVSTEKSESEVSKIVFKYASSCYIRPMTDEEKEENL